ncbi:MAG: alpha-amylase [Bacteroidales bacterium]|nr:alpha-amylase [Bacteroidales bacterium]
MLNNKLIIYQVLPRLFGNNNSYCIPNGTIEQNKCGKFADFTPKALKEIKKLGTTHIWYTGVIEHATQTNYEKYNIKPDHPAVVKGKAGSPYVIKDYFDVDPDLAIHPDNRMEEFEELIERTHNEGLKVIIDFVPNHVARQYHSDKQPNNTVPLGANDDSSRAFSPYNNFYYIPDTAFHGQFDMKLDAKEPYHEFPAKATGNNRFDAHPNSNDWYETVKLNYGVDFINGGNHHFDPIPDTWTKMLEILLFWASKQIDGLRCDMVEMVPVEFWEWAVPKVKAQYPNLLFIGEIYQPHLYKLYIEKGGFDYLYDKVGLYDTLRNIICGNQSATAITHCWQSLNGIQNKMLNFLENHDEQRIASQFFASNPFKAIPGLIVAACMNTNPILIYFGQELGELGMEAEGFSGRDGRTTIFDYWSISTIRRWRNNGDFNNKNLGAESVKLLNTYRKILNLCRTEKAINQGLFFDLMYANIEGWRFNQDKQYTFFRKHKKELILFVVNFDGVKADVAINIPQHAFEYLNIKETPTIIGLDLLSNESEEYSLLSTKATNISVPKYSARIVKFTLE